jgi:Lon protease-like protein
LPRLPLFPLRLVPLPDGRSRLLVTGGRRFQIRRLVPRTPYLSADVEFLEEGEPDPAAFILASRAQADFAGYFACLARISGQAPSTDPPSSDPALLSWVIAATLIIEMLREQRLREQTSVNNRLNREIDLLRREVTLLDLEMANRLKPVPSYGRD